MLHGDFIKLFHESNSVVEFAEKLGYKKNYFETAISPTYYKVIRRECRKLGLDYDRLTGRFDYEKYDSKIIKLTPECRSIRDILLKLGLSPDNGTFYRKIKNRVECLNLDTSHFTGAHWNRGQNKFKNKSLELIAKATETPWEEAFKDGSTIKNESLMKRLILSGKRIYVCSICGINKWDNKPIRLRLDHIDGNSSNNCENNLRFLCPNCDSQTDTFCRGNKNSIWWEELCK